MGDFSEFMNKSDEGKKKVAVGVSVYPAVKSELEALAASREIKVSTLVSKMIDFCLGQSPDTGYGA